LEWTHQGRTPVLAIVETFTVVDQCIDPPVLDIEGKETQMDCSLCTNSIVHYTAAQIVVVVYTMS